MNRGRGKEEEERLTVVEETDLVLEVAEEEELEVVEVLVGVELVEELVVEVREVVEVVEGVGGGWVVETLAEELELLEDEELEEADRGIINTFFFSLSRG